MTLSDLELIRRYTRAYEQAVKQQFNSGTTIMGILFLFDKAYQIWTELEDRACGEHSWEEWSGWLMCAKCGARRKQPENSGV